MTAEDGPVLLDRSVRTTATARYDGSWRLQYDGNSYRAGDERRRLRGRPLN